MSARCKSLAWIALFTLASAADARAQGWRFAGDLDLDVRYTRVDEPDVENGLAHVAELGMALDAYAGRRALGYALGVDVHLGAGARGGFAYEATLSPLGLGVTSGRWFRWYTSAGVSAHGVTAHVSAAMRLPVRTRVYIDLGRRLHMSGFAEAAWVSFADAREHGAPSAPFGDELSVGGHVRVGKGGREGYGTGWGNGYLLGATYRQRLGTSEFALVFGYGISTVAEP